MRNFGKVVVGVLVVFFVLEPVANAWAREMSPLILGTLWKLSCFGIGVAVGAWLKK